MIRPLHMRNVLSARLLKLLSASRFAGWGRKSWIVSPSAIRGPENIWLGNDVFVASGTCLAAQPLAHDASCKLEIGNGTRSGHSNHIVASSDIVLEDKVLTANNVYISDNLHRYDDPDCAILDQSLRQLPAVRIGYGSWIGHGACILGASVGRNCVIGAAAVVTKNIPDFSVAVGSPARVIKRYDHERQEWRAVSDDIDAR